MGRTEMFPGLDHPYYRYRLRVKEVLQERGVSPRYLVQRTGIAGSLIKAMLQSPDSYQPSYAKIAHIAAALHVPIDALVECVPVLTPPAEERHPDASRS